MSDNPCLPLRLLILPGSVEAWREKNIKRLFRISNDMAQGFERNHAPYAFGIAIGGIIFGAIHVAGWNFHFPTPIERKCWHIASILVMTALPLSLLPYISFTVNIRIADWIGILGVQVWGLLFGSIYFIARLFLLIESFRSLAFLPPDAFASTWVSNLPYVG